MTPIDTKILKKGVDLSGVETVSQYKQKLDTQRDVLEAYLDTEADPQTPRNMYDTFYDGNGRYSKNTQEFVDYYLTQKPEYDSRKYDMYDEEELQRNINANINNRYNQGYTQESDYRQDHRYPHPASSMGNSQIAHVLSMSRALNSPDDFDRNLGKSQSVQELNDRIRNAITSNRKPIFM